MRNAITIRDEHEQETRRLFNQAAVNTQRMYAVVAPVYVQRPTLRIVSVSVTLWRGRRFVEQQQFLTLEAAHAYALSQGATRETITIKSQDS